MVRTELGKISRAYMGMGGYQNVMFGLNFTFAKGGSSCVGDFWGTWADKPSPSAEWTLQDQQKLWGSMCLRIVKLLREAKVDKINDLEGTLVELTFNKQQLQEWRVLTEVI